MILKAENIQKIYGSRKVVKGISLEVQQGEIIGLLGPNGAGKTTSFYMIVGMIKPNAGKIFLGSIGKFVDSSKSAIDAINGLTRDLTESVEELTDVMSNNK